MDTVDGIRGSLVRLLVSMPPMGDRGWDHARHLGAGLGLARSPVSARTV